MTHLNDIVAAAKETFYGKQEYTTVIITVLCGKKKDVLEAETEICIRLDQDLLPCRNARITLGNWKGKEAQ